MLFTDEKNCFDIESCKKTVCRAIDISVPVTVTPFATTEKPEAKCVGDITVSPGNTCCESEHEPIRFTVTQRINVEIPLTFGAEICFDKSCAMDKDKCGESISVGQ
jgi:hypothetical protein